MSDALFAIRINCTLSVFFTKSMYELEQYVLEMAFFALMRLISIAGLAFRRMCDEQWIEDKCILLLRLQENSVEVSFLVAYLSR
jgi:hypothetical protein